MHSEPITLNKLRRPDPDSAAGLLIDRPFEMRVDLYLGPDAGRAVDPAAGNIFMGTCQPHTEEITAVYSVFIRRYSAPGTRINPKRPNWAVC